MAEAFDRARSVEDITRIILTYPELIDRGDFDGVGKFLDGVKFGTANGVTADEIAEEELQTLAAEEVTTRYSSHVLAYEDGLPHTKHAITNVDIWFSGDGREASSRCYYVVLQGLEDFPLQVVITGRYEDTFESDNGTWRLRTRREYSDIVGDLSRHVKPEVMAQLHQR
jgi:SnoaL-like domain